MISNEAVFWLLIVCGALGIVLCVAGNFPVCSACDISRAQFQNIVIFVGVFLMVSSWALIVNLVIKGFNIKDIKKTPWWIIGSLVWGLIFPFIVCVLLVFITLSSPC